MAKGHPWPFAAVAAELKHQADHLDECAESIRTTGVRLGLEDGSLSRAIFDFKTRADLIREGHRIMVALAPMENTIRAIADKV